MANGDIEIQVRLKKTLIDKVESVIVPAARVTDLQADLLQARPIPVDDKGDPKYSAQRWILKIIREYLEGLVRRSQKERATTTERIPDVEPDLS